MNLLLTGVVLGQLAHFAPSGYAGTLTLTDRSEVRVRTQPSIGPAMDADTSLGLAIGLAGRQSAYTLSYAPRFSVYDAFGDFRSYGVFHTGRVSGLWTTSRLSFGLAMDGSIGTQSSAGLTLALNPTAGTAPTPTPTDPTTPRAQDVRATFLLPSAVLYTGSASATANMGYAFSRRWATNVTANAGMSGGLEWISQQFLPPSRTVGGGVTLGHLLTQRDNVGLGTSVSYVHTLRVQPIFFERPINGGSFVTTTVALQWSHVFSTRTQGSLSGGISLLSRPREDQGPNETSASGTGTAAISHSAALNNQMLMNLTGSVAVSNVYNPFIGAVQRTAYGSFGVGFTRKKVTLNLTSSASVTLPLDDPQSSRFLSNAATLGYAPERWITLQTGVRVGFQLFPGPGADLPPQWVGFGAVQLTSPSMRF